MNSSPYLSHHTGYGQRTYGRSNSSSGYGFGDSTLGSYNNTTADSISSYYRAKYIIPEDGPAKSFLAPRYTPSSSTGYQLNRYKSSDNVPDTNYHSDYKLKKSTSATSFLPSSNTQSLLKSYNTSGDAASRQLPISQLRSRYLDNLQSPTETKNPFMSKKPEERKFAGKYGGESTYATAYLSRINKGRESKPREIDTRDINVSEKPRDPKWPTSDKLKGNNDAGTISRNRQVVRLTIKREKTEPEDPFTIRNKTLQTIAQRLIDKYQVPERKLQEPETVVKRRLPYQRLLSTEVEKRPIPPLTPKTSKPSIPVPRAAAAASPVGSAGGGVPETAVPVLQTPRATQITPKDPPATLQTPQGLRTTSSGGGEKGEDAAVVLQRATVTAETKDKLESWQEVKDAIYAAVLYPDVDIESDEEIDKLMKGGGDESSPEGSTKGKDSKGTGEDRHAVVGGDSGETEEEKKIEEEVGEGRGEGRRGDTSDSLKGKGKAIVGQLKKFVRQQESTNRSRKKRSKKRSSSPSSSSRRGSRGSRKDDEEEKSAGKSTDNFSKTGDKDGVVGENEKLLILNTTTPTSHDHLVQESQEKKNVDRVKDSSLAHDKDQEALVGNKGKVSAADKKPEDKTTTHREKSSILSPDLILKNAPKKPKGTETTNDTAEDEGRGGDASDTLAQNNTEKDLQTTKYTNRKGGRSLLSADLVLENNLASENESRVGKESEAKGKEVQASGGKLPQAGKCEKTSAVAAATAGGIPEGKKDHTSDEVQSTKIPKIKWKVKKPATTTKTTKEEENEKKTTSETPLQQSGGPQAAPPPSLQSPPSPSLSPSSISPPPPSLTTSLLPPTTAPSLPFTSAMGERKQTDSRQTDEQHAKVKTTGTLPTKLKTGVKQTEVKTADEEQTTGAKPEATLMALQDVNRDTEWRKQQSGINKAQPLSDPDNKNTGASGKPPSVPSRTEESGRAEETKENTKTNVTAPWRIKRDDNAATLKGKDEGDREYYTKKPVHTDDDIKTQVKDNDCKTKEFYTRTPIDNKFIKPKLNSSSVPDDDSSSNKEEKIPEKKPPAWKISKKKIQDASATQPTTTTTTTTAPWRDKASNRTLDQMQKTATITTTISTPSDRTEDENRTDSKTDSATTTTATTTITTTRGEEEAAAAAAAAPEKDVRNDEVSKLRGEREGQNKGTNCKDLKGMMGREDLNEGEAKRDLPGLPPTEAGPVKKALKRPRQVLPPPAPKEDATNELLKARNVLKRPLKQGTASTASMKGMSATDQSNSCETTTTTTKVPWRKSAAPSVSSSQGEQIQQARNILKRPPKPKEESKPTEQEAEKVLDSKTKLPIMKDEEKPAEMENKKAPDSQVKNEESKPPIEEKVEEKNVSDTMVKKLGVVKKSVSSVQSEVITAAGKEPKKLEPKGRLLRKQILPPSAAPRTRSDSSSSSSFFSSSSSDSEEDGYEASSTVRKKVEKPRRPMKARPAIGVTGKAAPQSPKSSSSSSLLGDSHINNTEKITDTPTTTTTTTLKTPAATQAKTTATKTLVIGNAKRCNKDTSTAPTTTNNNHNNNNKRGTELSKGDALPRQDAEEGGAGGEVSAAASQSADSGYGSCPSTPQPTHTAPDAKEEEAGAGAGEVVVEVVKEEKEGQCTVCGTNCHKKCEKQMPNLCGVNQKLLAEALSSVKKGGSADGTTTTTTTTSTTRTLAASPSKTSHSSVSGGSETEASTEDETDTTDTESDYFGLPEIRPPLQTCPKFKKYSLEDFNFIKVLGKGSYGKVMLAQQKDSENYFAVKCLKKDVVLEDNDVECTLIERKVLSLGTKHPYLCHLFCTFQTPSHLFFVMEYLTGGDLMFHIQHCGRFDEFRACFYGAEITSGLKFLHGKGIIYRDLKLDNILLDYQGHIRIADFGMCKLQVYLDRYADTFCGTPDYMAPEVIKGQHYNQCVDWWSFGVLLYEMLTGKSPFKGCDEDHLFWLICNDEPFFPKFLSKEATNILKQLLDKDSTRRLGIPFSPYGEITVHPFFKYIDWNKIERKEVETPYKPRLRHILDVQYFDPLFTKRQAAITPLDESILATMDQTPFQDFSYTNPNITD